MSKLIWITGLAGSGKTSIGKGLFKKIKKKEPNTVIIDGDHYREVFGHSGYSKKERLLVARNIVKLCNFLILQDINVICCTISLFKEIHTLNRKTFKNYYEIYISCNMEELFRRDQKGLYSKAIKGKIKNVVGVDIDFDEPINPFLIIKNEKKESLSENINKIIDKIQINENQLGLYKTS
jgi:adenylylsulfate kinase-like enzyme